MSEQVASARQKFNCPACGAEANWNPAKQALICPFCGTESPAQLKTVGADTVIVEHDLAAALRAIPDSARGWQTATMSVRCQSCQAISVFDPQQIGKRCEFCGSSALVPYEEVKEPFRPESLLPLKISESQARDLIRAWYGRQWLAPNRFRLQAITDTVKGIYLPYWTFDAQADARWTAEAGKYYYVREGGKNVQQVAVDAGVRRADARVRRRAGVRVGGRGCEPAAEHRAVSDGLAGAVRSRLPVRMDRRALPDRSRQGRRAFAPADGGHPARAVRAAGPG